MNELPFIETPEVFKQELQRLHALRKDGNIKSKRLYRLTKEERKIIYLKTNGKCHVCADKKFQLINLKLTT